MFDSIFFNGEEYKQMWLNGSMIWEKDSGGSGAFPYEDADCVITYANTSSSAVSKTFTVIDSSLPYSINGVTTKTFSFPSGETKIKLVNLKPLTDTMADTSFFMTNVEQLRLPNLTDLSGLFARFGYSSSYTYSWQPQYFEFNENVTTLKNLFFGTILTDELMNQFMPYFPNTANVINMSQTFCTKLTSLDLSSWDTSQCTNMAGMFCNNSSLKELDLSSFDTSKVTLYGSMFSSVNGATIYIGDKWTLGTSATLGGGTNNTFVKYVPIESIGELVCNVDTSNVTSPTFTISTTIAPSNYASMDLEVIYDSNYLTTSDNFTFGLLDGCQGRTLDITYRSKKDNSISKTITITISEDWEELLLIDFTQSTAPTYISWFTEETKDSTYYFRHGTVRYSTSYYGLGLNRSGNMSINWSCYKIIAPITGTLQFTYWAKCASTGYSGATKFSIHSTTNATQPRYSSSTDRIAYVDGKSTYATTDAITTMNVVKGETCYIHLQFYGSTSATTYNGAVIRSIEILPSIKSIDGFTYDVDLNNIEQQKFTVSPIIKPTNYNTNDLEIVYDSNYMAINPTTFEIVLYNGSQDMSHTVTYRSKADNSISKSFTFYVSENLTSLPYLVNLQQFPTWFTEETKNSSYYYTYGAYNYDKTLCGLVENTYSTSTSTYWTCYKVVAPTTGSLDITFRAYTYSSSYPFVIHSTTSTTQPTYNSSTDRILNATGTTYRTTDGVASIHVSKGETYYIHIQHRRYGSSSTYGSCIRSIKLIP